MTKKANDVVLVSLARTAFDKFGGPTKDVSSVELSEAVIRELLKRYGLKPEQIDEVNLGSCILPEIALQTDIPARQALIRAGLPQTTLSNNIDRACCSSTSALQMSWKNLMLGESEISMVLGVDNMGRCPGLLHPKYRFEGFRMGGLKVSDPLFNLGYEGMGVLAVDAGEVALENGVTREMQDEWAAGSHEKWGKAFDKGYFAEEIFPLEIRQGKKPPIVLDRDQSPRPGTTPEALAKLPLVYGSPTVSAGNAPGLNAGACGVIVTTRKKAEALGLAPLAKILRVASIAEPYRNIAIAPAPAIRKGLEMTGLTLKDLELIEINEAFAAMPLVATKVLAEGNEAETKRLRDITNVNGGAVAIGHPVGASGLRITMTLIRELRNRGGRYGAAAICGGLAQGDSVIVEAEYN